MTCARIGFVIAGLVPQGVQERPSVSTLQCDHLWSYLGTGRNENDANDNGPHQFLRLPCQASGYGWHIQRHLKPCVDWCWVTVLLRLEGDTRYDAAWEPGFWRVGGVGSLMPGVEGFNSELRRIFKLLVFKIAQLNACSMLHKCSYLPVVHHFWTTPSVLEGMGGGWRLIFKNSYYL